MFCFHCGTNCPDGTAFCEKCGTDLRCTLSPATAAVPESAPAPESSSPIVPKEAPVIPSDSGEIPAKKARKSPVRFKKPLQISITVTMILSILLVLVSGVIMLSTNVTEMGIVNWGMDTFLDLDLQEELDDLNETRRELKTKYNNEFATLTKAQRNDLKKMINEIEDVQKDSTLLKLIRFLDYLVAEAGEPAEESPLFSVSNEYLQNFSQTKTILFVVIGLLYLLPVLFALLGGLLKNTGLTVTALILTVLVQALSGTVIPLVVSLVVYLVQILFCKLLKKVNAAPAL